MRAQWFKKQHISCFSTYTFLTANAHILCLPDAIRDRRMLTIKLFTRSCAENVFVNWESDMNIEQYFSRHLPAASREAHGKYTEAREIFMLLFRALRRQGHVPTAAQLNGLYFAIRWRDRVSNKRKKEVWNEHFAPSVAKRCAQRLSDASGIIGGAKGSIAYDLERLSARRHFWQLLEEVAKARDMASADRAVLEYAKAPVCGLGRSIVSSFLWALQPEMYPIVNGSNLKGLCAAINGFPLKNDVRDFITWDVPCLRDFSSYYRIRTFSILDRILCLLSRDLKNAGVIISETSRFSYRPAQILREALVEGEKIERKMMTRKRDARLRADVLNERGNQCQVCDMRFRVVYGVDYAEVHHIDPLSKGGVRDTNPDRLLVVCRNCHAMLHSPQFEGRSWQILQKRVATLRRYSG